MAGTMTYDGLTQEQVTYFYSFRLLTRAVANFAYARVAQLGQTPKETIPANKGDTVQWRSYTALSAATTALSEGQTPTVTEVSMDSTTATVEEYGAYIRYTAMLQRKGIDNNKVNFSKLLGEQAGNTVDQLTRDIAVATTNYIYPTGRSARTDILATDVLNASLIRKGIRNLRRSNALPIVGNRYIGIIHPDTYFDMIQDSTIENALLNVFEKSESGNPLLAGYMGTVFGVDWYESTNAKVYTAGGSGSVDVYATMIFGQDGLGIAGLAGMMPGAVASSQYMPNTGKSVMPVTLIDTPPDTPSKDDPLRQRGTLGWKTTFVAKILNQNFLVKIEHGATA
jgi:N4-gp56 family major capsid protein